MQRAEDVQRLLSVLREYEDNLRMLPKDFIQMTVRALDTTNIVRTSSAEQRKRMRGM